MTNLKAHKENIRKGKQVVPVDAGVLEVLKKFDTGFSGFLETFAREMSEKIVQRLLQNEDVLYELAVIAGKQINRDILKGDPGKPGKPGEPGRTPVKGVDYFDGEPGKPGAPGKNGENFFTHEQEKQFLAMIVDEVLTGVKKDGASIVDAVNGLEIKPEFQIDASHIKNLPEVTIAESKKSVKMYGSIHRGGLKLIWNTQLEGTMNGVNTTFTIPASLPDPKDNRFIVSARGVAKDIDSGDFTVSNNNRTITFTVAPPNGSARPRIQLYHGK